ncbi:ABC transporter substrate-binding protein [Leucobacter sp.]
MQRRKTAIALLASAALLALAGCAAPADDTSTLRVIRAESFDGWNPDGAAAYSTYQSLANVIEPLLRANPDGQTIDPGIATEWEYDPDAYTWTFTLRDGVEFSDGTPLTTDDVLFSAGVWVEGPNYGSLFSGISEVTAPDDRTVVFRMAEPDNSLPVLLTWTSAGIFPEDFGGVDEEEYWQKPVGAGAFKVESWSTGGQTVLSANEHYYEEVGVDRIVFDTVTDTNQGAALIESGQADISEYISPQASAAYGESIVALPPSLIEHLSFNVTRAPLDDLHLRSAIAHAVDGDAIIEGAFKGFGAEPRGIIPSGLAGWAGPTAVPPSFDPDRAKAEIALVASPPKTLEVIYDASNEADDAVAQIMKQNLIEIGIDLRLTPLETGAFLDRAYGLDADMMIWSYGAISPDVIDPLAWITGTSWLFSGADTARVESQFKQYAATEAPEDRAGIIRELQDDAIEELPVFAVAEFQALHAAGPRVEGFAPTPWGLYRMNTITLEDR